MAHDHSHGHGGHCSSSSSSHSNNNNNNNNNSISKHITSIESNNKNETNDNSANNNNNNNNDNNNNNKAVLRRLYIATFLCGTFFMVEVIGGLWSHSLAILSDAAHLLADLCSFCVAMIAAHLASMPSSEFHTYGLKRAESLAALLSMVSLAIVSIGLAYEAIRRLFFLSSSSSSDDDHDHKGQVNSSVVQVNGQLMSTVAAIGVCVNIVLALVLGEHHTHMPGADHGCSHHGDGDGDHHDHHGHQKGSSSSSNGGDGGCGHGDHDHSHSHSHDHNAKFLPQSQSQHANINNEHTALLPAVHHDHELLAGDVDVESMPSSSSSTTMQKKKKKKKNINLHAAYIHVMGDLCQSAAVLIAGLIIYWQPTWHVVDPICTLVFCGIVFASTIPVIRSSVAVLIEEVPPNVDWKAVHDAIQNVPNVTGVHDLHIWSISHGIPGLSVHCFVQEGRDAITIQQQALRDIHAVCVKHGISHVTIQAQLVVTSTTTSSLSTTAATATTAEDCITCADDPCCVQRSQIV